ncbi:MAG TPA: MauE/DoxX family redox-associated membrane protein [Solirubrobacteraceae bacterium]|nr:MauE/DoxX family redox-associated membrane protein [Solirubrobacteraceae bacterium]
MLSVVFCLLLGLVLLASAILKLVDREGTQSALATYGIRRGAPVVWGSIVAAELVLAVGVSAGIDAAAYTAAALMAVFAGAQGVALARGRGGAPCACFGARGHVSGGSIARAAVLAAAFAAAPSLPRSEPTTEEWLGLGLAVALLGLAALAVVVLALAREVGMLRLSLDPRGALEVAHEGPEVGARSALAERFGDELAPGRIGLAVFSSEGCQMCRALAPAVASFGRDPRVVLRDFDEVRDADAWTVADVPGSPFAVALDADGTVLAKGTFNTGAQLESVLGSAERRRGVVNA